MLRGRYPHAAFSLKMTRATIGATPFFFLFALTLLNPYIVTLFVNSVASTIGSSSEENHACKPSISNSITVVNFTHTDTNANTMSQKRGRPKDSTHVNLDLLAVFEFCEAHLVTASGPADTFPYSKGRSTDVKKSVVWSEVKRIRTWKWKTM